MHLAQRYYQRRRADSKEPYRLEDDYRLRRYVRDKADGGELWKYLRQSHRRRRKRYGSQEHRGQMPGRRMIDKRLKVVNERKRVGDWESDTIEGRKSAGLLATHVERKCGYTVAVKLDDKSADTVTRATLEAMRKLPLEKIKTMTFDKAVELLNNRPRKCLNYRTPTEVFRSG